MNTRLRKPSISGLLRFACVCGLVIGPNVSEAQTFFGSGGTSNTATYTDNVALGWAAFSHNTSGQSNTAIGYATLFSNTTGYYNTANGYQALYYNTIGIANTANGYNALVDNTTGNFNSAYGSSALWGNTAGYHNVAVGYAALNSNTIGNYNVASGSYSLANNLAGSYNVASGHLALIYNTTGNGNTAEGFHALYYTTGSNNTALGYGAGQNLTTGSNNIAIGNQGIAGDNGVIRIGTQGTHNAAFIGGVSGATVANGVQVFINANGQLGTIKSSRRFKNDIKNMGDISDRLMQLRPVTFRYNDQTEKGPHALQYGLIAEEVAKIYPDLVQYDKSGKPYTIYYHLLTPMLLSELQKQHRRNAEQQEQIASLKSELAAVKLAQAQQVAVLTKLSAYVQTAQHQGRQQQAVFFHP